MKTLEQRVADIEHGHRRLSDVVQEVKAGLERNNAMTSDIHDMIQNLKGFMTTVRFIGKTFWFIGKYLVLPFLLLAAIFFAATHGGKLPPWFGDAVKLLLA